MARSEGTPSKGKKLLVRPVIEGNGYTVTRGDCMMLLKRLPDNSIDSIVTDPPYGLGFMGKAWDDLPPGEPWARECLRVLKPGGHLLAFGGTRTWHRLACAVEDAGFEIRDSIAWLYSSGFPKSHNLADEWKGWGTALKPAFEPIVVGRKAFSGTIAANVLAHGTGALNIDGCRSSVGKDDDIFAKNPNTSGGFGHAAASIYGDSDGAPVYNPSAGRWPANVALDGSHADVLDEQGNASRFFATFRYQAKAPAIERVKVNGVVHPTVKPLELMRWLVRLVTPPGGTVLDPFAGSGTTAEAAILEGARIIAFERERDYMPLIRVRIERALANKVNVPVQRNVKGGGSE